MCLIELNIQVNVIHRSRFGKAQGLVVAVSWLKHTCTVCKGEAAFCDSAGILGAFSCACSFSTGLSVLGKKLDYSSLFHRLQETQAKQSSVQ